MGPFKKQDYNEIICVLNKIKLFPNTTIFFNNFKEVSPEKLFDCDAWRYMIDLTTLGPILPDFQNVSISTNYDEGSDEDSDGPPDGSRLEELYYNLIISSDDGFSYYEIKLSANDKNKLQSIDKFPIQPSLSGTACKIYNEYCGFLPTYKEQTIYENFIFLCSKDSYNLRNVDLSGIDFVIIFGYGCNLEYLGNFSIKEVIIVTSSWQHFNTIRIKYNYRSGTKKSISKN